MGHSEILHCSVNQVQWGTVKQGTMGYSESNTMWHSETMHCIVNQVQCGTVNYNEIYTVRTYTVLAPKHESTMGHSETMHCTVNQVQWGTVKKLYKSSTKVKHCSVPGLFRYLAHLPVYY